MEIIHKVSCLFFLCGFSWGFPNRDIDLNLRFVNQEKQNFTRTLFINEQKLQRLNVTKEYLESLLMPLDLNGEATLNINGRDVVFAMGNKTKTLSLHVFSRFDNTTWMATRSNYTNASLIDLKEDKSLIPMNYSLKWEVTNASYSKMQFLLINSGVNYTSLHINNKTISFAKSNVKGFPPGIIYRIQNAGIYIHVLNEISEVILNVSYNTQHPLVDQEVQDTLRSLRPGRIVVLSTLYDCTTNLRTKLRNLLSKAGSVSAPLIFFRDSWIWVWVVGGKSLGEAFIPHRSPVRPASHVSMELLFPVDSKRTMCSNWLNDTLWRKRAIFCETYEGYGDLCFCDLPFIVTSPSTKKENETDNILTVILAGNRPRYLYRLIKDITQQQGANFSLILTSVDGSNEETVRLCDVLNIQYIVYNPEGERHIRISRHLRFALYNAIQQFSEIYKILILEEDLELAPDFYFFMQTTSVLFDEDPTVYSVSAYSHMAYNHTAWNVSKLYRAYTLPSYGWMVTRKFIEEILPMWPPPDVNIPWDYWINSDYIREGREVVYPEVPRTKHSGILGSNVNGFTALMYHGKPISTNASIKVDTKSVIFPEYENETIHLLEKATVLNVANPYNKTFLNKTTGNVFIIPVKMETSVDGEAICVLADALHIWSKDVRDHHNGLWRMPYNNFTLLILGCPFSQYCSNFLFNVTDSYTPDENDKKIYERNIGLEEHTYISHLDSDDLTVLGLQSPHGSHPNITVKHYMPYHIQRG